MGEMSDDEVKEQFQVVSAVVRWDVADILRVKPEWTTEQAEHFIDSSYREIVAEAREAGDRMIAEIIEEIEKNGRLENN